MYKNNIKKLKKLNSKIKVRSKTHDPKHYDEIAPINNVKKSKKKQKEKKINIRNKKDEPALTMKEKIRL